MDCISDLTSAPIVGQTYLVRVVTYRWLDMVDEWPVNGTRHRDALLDFDIDHWHVDGRFLTPEQEERAVKEALGLINALGPEARGHPMHGLTGDALVAEAARLVILTPEAGTPLPRSAELKPRVCSRAPITACLRSEWAERRLATQYGPKPLAIRRGERLFCPHQGGDLTLVPDNEDGTRTCPLHGMRCFVPKG